MQQDFLLNVLLLGAFFSISNMTEAQEKTVTDSIKLPTAVVVGYKPSKGNVTAIDRATLDRVQSRTLGETLSYTPGVQNAYFGPNSGTPMIRSLSGNRVKVLTNSLSFHDLSGITPNVNINVDMDNLLGIDVYKGGASVLYGGKAIGGAVNMRDNTIPEFMFPNTWYGRATVEAGTNSGNRQAVDVNGNLGERWAWHIGGMNQQNNDLRIPGNTKAPIAYDPAIDHLTQAMAQVHVDSETIRNLSLYPYLSQFVLDYMSDPRWDLSEADLYTFQDHSVIGGVRIPNPVNDQYVAGQDPSTPLSTTIVKGISDYAPVKKGIMPNSHSESRAVNVGSSYIRRNYRIGLGYRASEGYYGIPGFALATIPKHTHEPVAQAPEYAPINTRALSHSLLFESAYRPTSSMITNVKLNYMFQYADDRELVGIYRVNKFNTNRHTFRTEVEQQVLKFWKGMSGLDFSHLKIDGGGVQRYIPNNQSHEVGAFTLQKLDFNPVVVNLGYRHDWVARRATRDGTYKTSRGMAGGKLSARDFHLNHFTGDLRWSILKIAYLEGAVSHAERAPDVNELYAGNNHFAILVEENGDDRLPKEIARSYELGGGLQYKGLHFNATYYQTTFENYLYLAHTGISRSGGFLVKEWRASDTEINGIEAQLGYKHSWKKGRSWEVSTYCDLVKNRNTADDSMRQWAEGDYMPNLPTSRYGLSAGALLNRFMIFCSFDRYLEQRFLGKNINPEPPMPAYSLLAACISYPLQIVGYTIECYARGNNLLDVEARPQNSFLKYLAPLPGRNISLGIKVVI
ncbi:TonB-dependent receptor [Sphingobacterium pedocola]|uniref:TonB-dependent receptor n=1 Tax=Sphingobacterium pedocola TaxID=2082722 RepID=A0ABR9TCE7_9SPHI|nr:TonB-dependent receptor [Sphingobacterium pedocola]MBE8722287.1 hypothetical protein [Sphingobacterium pedocola]